MDAEFIADFEIHRAVPAKHKEADFAYNAIFKACEKQRNVLLHYAMNDNLQKLLRLVKQNEGENNRQKARIYPIILKENQRGDLPLYLKKLMKRLLKNRVRLRKNVCKQQLVDTDQENCKEDNDEDEDEDLSIFGDSDAFDRVFIKQREGTEVRDILLDIYADSEDIDGKPDFEYYVYVITNVTDLSEDNLYIFSKGITNKNFIVIMPTYQNFENEQYQSAPKLSIEKYVSIMFDSKALFSQYIYNCIKNPKIKAYLPAQILSLITDMDFYHLSFEQSCRRFNHCLFKALQLNPAERPPISIERQIQKIEEILKEKFLVRKYNTNWYNILRVILTEQETYKISQSTFSTEMSFRRKEYQIKYPHLQQEYTEQMFIQKISNSFGKHLQKNELAIFEQKEEILQKGIRSKRKKSRMDELGINTRQITPKIVLENSITRIIKTLTKEVRKYSKTLKWSTFKFNERIKPCIPLKIVQAMKNEDDDIFVQMVEDITSHHFKQLSSLLSYFDEQSIGYGLYLIKTMQLSGLITLSKKEINPNVFNNFYEKAKFN